MVSRWLRARGISWLAASLLVWSVLSSAEAASAVEPRTCYDLCFPVLTENCTRFLEAPCVPDNGCCDPAHACVAAEDGFRCRLPPNAG